MKTIIFFNNKGGVGKTDIGISFHPHDGWNGYTKCLAVDLDPQSNLTAMFLPDEELERIYAQDFNRNINFRY